MKKKIIISGVLTIFVITLVIAQVVLPSSDDTITLTKEREQVLERMNNIDTIDINVPEIICDGKECFTNGSVFQEGLINMEIRILDLGYTDEQLKSRITSKIQTIINDYADAQIERETRRANKNMRIDKGKIILERR